MTTATTPVQTGAKCSVARALDTIADPANRTWFASAMDGQVAEYATPADASILAESMGFRMSAAIIRRHRRRLTGRGEKCWCPA